MTLPNDERAADLISVGADALVKNSIRLGISWRLRLATVSNAIDSNSMEVLIDGDSVSIVIVSMIGEVPAGRRVYVITIPPAGNYAVGFVSGNYLIADLRHEFNTQLTSSTSTSTTYANLTNIAGVAFVAPFSGIVTIHYTARLGNSLATGGAALTPWVGEGSTVGAGTEILASSDVNALLYLLSTAAEDIRMGGHHTLSGLTAGTEYNVSMRGRMVTAGTASFDDIATTVVPSP
jgi:hypothetical protein